MTIVSLILYFLGAIVMTAHIDAFPVYPRWHRLAWVNQMVVALWPIIVTWALALFVVDTLRGKRTGK